MTNHEHFESLADDVLLHNIGQGCADCFALLFRRYCHQVSSVSYRIIRNKAETEDILQEVFLSIYLQHERYDPARGSIRTWILQFAYFKALLRRRYLKVRHFYNDEQVSEARKMHGSENSCLLGMSAPELAHYVETGIGTLGTKNRRVIKLVHLEGCTLQEAAELVRESLANTRNLYYRGLKQLKEFLTGKAALKAREAVRRRRSVTVDRPEQTQAAEVSVMLGKVVRTTPHAFVNGFGTVEPQPATSGQPPASARIGVPVAGLVAESRTVEGERVQKGATLFQLDSRVADVQVEKARQSIEFAQLGFERHQHLLSVEGTSKKLYQDAEQQSCR